MVAAGTSISGFTGCVGLDGPCGVGADEHGGVSAPAAVSQTGKQRRLERPLPDIPTLMHEVESHQKAAEAIQKDYLYHEVRRAEDGWARQVKKTDTREFDVFWIEGVPVRRMTKKNGKELSAEEAEEGE